MTEHAGANSLKDDRHELFCQEYLKDLNITQAGIRAGYSTKSAKQHCSKLFAKPEIQERIACLKEIRMNELGLDAYYVLKNLKSIAERCMQGEQVTDREGEPVFVQGPDEKYAALYKFDSQGAIKANELIGKHIGMFVEQKKINVEVDLMSELIDELSEE